MLQPCPRCGAQQPREATGGLCPACLVREVAGGSPDAPLPTDPPAVPDIGSRLGDYELEAIIGGGGMGVVYRARQLSLNRPVALKLLPFGRFTPDALRRRFQAEAEAIARLRHPHIVTIHEIGENGGQPFLAMELIDGPDLAQLARDRPIAVREAARLTAAVAAAIAHAHERGIVHRDLKPSNILVGADGQPRVTDFGLAKDLTERAELTQPGEAFGSPHYLPPELAGPRAGSIQPASDLYGLGAILYHLLTRRPPFVGASPAAVLQQVATAEPLAPRLLNPEVPRDLETICLKCLEKNPAARYASALELADELERFLRDEPIRARPISAAARGWRWCRRRPALAGVSALALLLFVAGATASIVLWRRAEERARQAAVSLARVEFDRAEDLFARGESPEALARLARLLRADPADSVVAQRIVTALTHRNFLQPVSDEFEHGGTGRFVVPPLAGDRIATLANRSRQVVLWRTAPALTRDLTIDLPRPARLQAMSGDGSRLAVVLNDHTLELRALAEPGRAGARRKFPAAPRAVRLDATGRLALVVLAANAAEVLDAAIGATVHTLAGAHFAEFSHDGRLLASAAGREATIWDTATWQPLGKKLRHGYRIETARFSPDSARVVTASADKSAVIWSARTGEPFGRTLVHREQLLDAVFSPDGQRVLTESLSAQAQLWDAVAGAPLGAPFPQWRELHGGLFSPDGFTLVSHYQDRVVLRDAFTGRPLSEPLQLGSTAATAIFLPAGDACLITGSNGRGRVWSARPTGALAPPLWHEIELSALALSPDGTKILTAGKDAAARVWSVPEGRPLTPPLAHERRVGAVAFDPTGALIATGDATEKIFLREAATGNPRGAPLVHPGEITALRFLPGGELIVASSLDGTLRIWRVADGTIAREVRPGGAVNALALSPDGRRLATAGDDRTARVINLAGGAADLVLPHASSVQSVAFAPDGTLATGDNGGFVRFWDLARQAESGEPLRHTRAVNALAFTLDGRRLLTASADRTARLWDVATRRALARPLAHGASVVQARFSPDERHILTASYDHTARVWDAASGRPVSDPLAHGNRVLDAVWMPDGKRVVTASWDASARIWSLPLPSAAPDDAAWLSATAEIFARQRIDADDVMHNLPATRPAPPPASSALADWAAWRLVPPTERGLAPGLSLRAEEFLRAQLDAKQPARLLEALRVAPLDATGLARWSRLVLRESEHRNPRRHAEALFAATNAAEMAPQNHEAWWSVAEAQLASGNREAAHVALVRALTLAPAELPAAERRVLEALRRRLESTQR